MRKLLFIATLFALVATPAMADVYGTVDLDFVDVDPGVMSVQIWSSSYPASPPPGGTTLNLGVHNLSLSNASAGIPSGWVNFLTGDVGAFCIDLWDQTYDGTTQYDVRPLSETPDPFATGDDGMGTKRAAYMSELLDKYWTDSLSNVDAAAIQAVIWEIVDEDRFNANPDESTWDVTDGTFIVGVSGTTSQAIVDAATLMLTDILKDGASYTGTYAGLSNPSETGPKLYNYQDFVVRVPVPGAVLLGMLGLGAAGLKLRRRSA